MVISSAGQVQATDGQTTFSRPIGTVPAVPREENPRVAVKEVAVHDTKNLEENIRQLQKISDMMDRKIQFSVNRETDRVVIKIVDPATDKVIKEIPSADVQKLQARIMEVVGLLFDEML
jgi:flagellar protein FlaG